MNLVMCLFSFTGGELLFETFRHRYPYCFPPYRFPPMAEGSSDAIAGWTFLQVPFPLATAARGSEGNVVAMPNACPYSIAFQPGFLATSVTVGNPLTSAEPSSLVMSAFVNWTHCLEQRQR